MTSQIQKDAIKNLIEGDAILLSTEDTPAEGFAQAEWTELRKLIIGVKDPLYDHGIVNVTSNNVDVMSEAMIQLQANGVSRDKPVHDGHNWLISLEGVRSRIFAGDFVLSGESFENVDEFINKPDGYSFIRKVLSENEIDEDAFLRGSQSDGSIEDSNLDKFDVTMQAIEKFMNEVGYLKFDQDKYNTALESFAGMRRVANLTRKEKIHQGLRPYHHYGMLMDDIHKILDILPQPDIDLLINIRLINFRKVEEHNVSEILAERSIDSLFKAMFRTGLEAFAGGKNGRLLSRIVPKVVSEQDFSNFISRNKREVEMEISRLNLVCERRSISFKDELGSQAYKVLCEQGLILEGKPVNAVRLETYNELFDALSRNDHSSKAKALKKIDDLGLFSEYATSIYLRKHPLLAKKVAQAFDYRGEELLDYAKRADTEHENGAQGESTMLSRYPYILALCENMPSIDQEEVRKLKESYIRHLETNSAKSSVFPVSLGDEDHPYTFDFNRWKECPSFMYRALRDLDKFDGFTINAASTPEKFYLNATNAPSALINSVANGVDDVDIKSSLPEIRAYLTEHAPLIGTDSPLYKKIERAVMEAANANRVSKVRSPLVARVLGSMSSLDKLNDRDLHEEIAHKTTGLTKKEIELSLSDFSQVTGLTEKQKATLERCVSSLKEIQMEHVAVARSVENTVEAEVAAPADIEITEPEKKNPNFFERMFRR